MWFIKIIDKSPKTVSRPELIAAATKEIAIEIGLDIAHDYSKDAIYDSQKEEFVYVERRNGEESLVKIPIRMYGREDIRDERFHLFDINNQLIASTDTLKELMCLIEKNCIKAILMEPYYRYRWMRPYFVKIQDKPNRHYRAFGYIQHKGYPFVYCDFIDDKLRVSAYHNIGLSEVELFKEGEY